MAADPSPFSSSSSSSDLPVLVPAPSWVPLPEPFPACLLEAARAVGSCGGGGGDGASAGIKPPSVPALLRFCPPDGELVEYLVKKVQGRMIPAGIIIDIDLYAFDAGTLPRDFTYNDDEGEGYYFTVGNRKNPSRCTPGGYWKAIIRETPIPDAAGVVIGFKRMLVFCSGKPPAGRRTNWVMEEFRLNLDLDVFKTHNQPDQMDTTVCKVYDRTTRTPDKDETGN